MSNDCRPGPEVIKLFSCSSQLNMKFVLLINLKPVIANSLLLNIAEHEIFSANMKMPTIILLAEKISCSAKFSMKKRFITSGPGPLFLLITHVQRYEKMILMACAHSESLDQPVHTCVLIFGYL